MRYIRYLRTLRRLERERKEAADVHATVMRKAIENQESFDSRARLASLRIDELSMCDAEIEAHITRYLMTTAHQLLLPTPPHIEERHGGCWKVHEASGAWYLTRAGMAQLRKDIRAERDARRQVFIAWSGVLIGLIGAVTGLVSVWND